MKARSDVVNVFSGEIWLILPPPLDTLDLCSGHVVKPRLTGAEVSGVWSMSGPKISRCSGSCMLKSPNRLEMKCRDSKTNLEPDENLIKA
jgi:hypothetical protein